MFSIGLLVIQSIISRFFLFFYIYIYLARWSELLDCFSLWQTSVYSLSSLLGQVWIEGIAKCISEKHPAAIELDVLYKLKSEVMTTVKRCYISEIWFFYF